MTGAWEVLLIFLRLGCTSFGGPVAHIGYFRAESKARGLRMWSFREGLGLLIDSLGATGARVIAWNDEHVVHQVLLEILEARTEYDLKPLLARIPGRRLDLSTTHPDIADFLRHSIDGLQNTALTALRYAPPQAIAIMTAALRIVVEETFLLVP